VVWLRQPCSPCLDSDCRFGHTDCLAGIPPATVMAALRRTSVLFR
jgi:ADP-heptose:LPS heptosyltransferase